MSATPPMSNATPRNGERDRTPDVTNRERRHREHDENDRDRQSSRRPRDGDEHEHDRDRERERRERHRRHYEEGDDEERRERKRRYERDEETDEDRERRRRRREERESQRGSEHGDRDRERGDRDRERSGRDHRSRDDYRERDREREREREREHRHRDRDRSRESMRSYRSRDRERERDPDSEARRLKSNDEREAERARRDREMQEERREHARRREEHFAELDRQREMDRRRDRPHRSPSRQMRSPFPAHLPPPPPPESASAEPAVPEDPGAKLLHEVDSEARSVFVSQLAARLTSADLGLFFEDKLGRGAVRDARVVMDKVSRRSKGIGYVELDDVELVNRAVALSGQVVMGIPIQIQLTESEKNREGVDIASIMAGGRHSQGIPRSTPSYAPSFPPLSTGLQYPPGYDPTANQHASIPYHRLFVSNIASTLNRDDIYQVFEAFGEIVFVDLQHHMNGASKEQAYVQFKELRAAQMAVDAMNGFELAGRHIKVVAFQERTQIADQIDDTRRGPKMDNYARQQLMLKLARQDGGQRQNERAPPPPSRPADPTNYLLVSNMFNPDEETDRNWDLDLAEDIKGEVERQYGPVKRIKVDKMSRGDVYLEFEAPRVSQLAQKGLSGRFFGGRKLQAEFISEAVLKMHM